jgi:hypothetical protein
MTNYTVPICAPPVLLSWWLQAMQTSKGKLASCIALLEIFVAVNCEKMAR